MTSPDPAPDPVWTVVYDPDCGFCRWTLGTLLSADRSRRLRPLALGTAEADALLHDLTPEQRAASFHVVAPAGDHQSAGAAGPTLLALLPGGRVPAALFRRAPRLTERSYELVAGNRSTLSRLVPGRLKQRATERIDRRVADGPRGSEGR